MPNENVKVEKDAKPTTTEKEKVAAATETAKPMTEDELISSMVREITEMYISGIGMQDIRRQLNVTIQNCKIAIPQENRREFARKLREKFERLRQYSESAHGEVIAATSQEGW